jgi:hypothetical protein
MNMKRLKRYIVILLFCTVIVAGINIWNSQLDKKHAAMVASKFSWKTGLIFSPDTQILDGKDSSSRDIIMEVVITIPRDQLSEFKQKTPINMIAFQKEDYLQGQPWFLSTFSFHLETKNEPDYWEHGEGFCGINNGFNLVICITNAYKANVYHDRYVVYLRYISK